MGKMEISQMVHHKKPNQYKKNTSKCKFRINYLLVSQRLTWNDDYQEVQTIFFKSYKKSEILVCPVMIPKYLMIRRN